MGLVPRIIKRSTDRYSKIYTVDLPVQFYFSLDGSFDGIEVCAKSVTPFESALIESLCTELKSALSSCGGK